MDTFDDEITEKIDFMDLELELLEDEENDWLEDHQLLVEPYDDELAIISVNGDDVFDWTSKKEGSGSKWSIDGNYAYVLVKKNDHLQRDLESQGYSVGEFYILD